MKKYKLMFWSADQIVTEIFWDYDYNIMNTAQMKCGTWDKFHSLEVIIESEPHNTYEQSHPNA